MVDRRTDAAHVVAHARAGGARLKDESKKKLGELDNASQEPWKASRSAFLEELYFKRRGKERRDVVRSVEELVNASRG